MTHAWEGRSCPRCDEQFTTWVDDQPYCRFCNIQFSWLRRAFCTFIPNRLLKFLLMR